jgi:uncharacterized membrane protein YdbT with pleckstrin-like domain
VTKLLEHEREIRLTRQHWAVFVPVVSVCLLILVGGFVILKLLPGTIAGHEIHNIKVFIGLVLALFVAVVLGLKYLKWRFTTYMLTDRRILLSRGVLSRVSESINLDRIQDTAIRQSLMGRILRAGDVEIESAGENAGTQLLHLIKDPQGFSDTLQLTVEAHRTGQPYPGAGPRYGAPAGQPLPQGYVPPGTSGLGPPPGYGPPPSGGGV